MPRAFRTPALHPFFEPSLRGSFCYYPLEQKPELRQRGEVTHSKSHSSAQKWLFDTRTHTLTLTLPAHCIPVPATAPPMSVHGGVRVQDKTPLLGNDLDDVGSHLATLTLVSSSAKQEQCPTPSWGMAGLSVKRYLELRAQHWAMGTAPPPFPLLWHEPRPPLGQKLGVEMSNNH